MPKAGTVPGSSYRIWTLRTVTVSDDMIEVVRLPTHALRLPPPSSASAPFPPLEVTPAVGMLSPPVAIDCRTSTSCKSSCAEFSLLHRALASKPRLDSLVSPPLVVLVCLGRFLF